VLEALQALGLRRLLLLSPYKSNQAVIDYLSATGFAVVHDVALGLKSLEFAAVTPREWAELARNHDRSDTDGIFLSCTNTTQIEAVAEIEDALGKPVVNSNQAVLWGCVKRLKSALAPLPPMARLGRLMRHLDA
jgi:maleate cis-trans isomerase